MVYIPKQQILTRFKRYKELNETRLAHALSLMSQDARYCLSIVPVLLHYNHINLPGYRNNDVPHGIDMFHLDALQKRYLHETIAPSAPKLQEPKEHAILGLYAMGSTSSLGQSDSSDVDIWVCVKANLSQERTKALQDKCRFITNYIKSQGVELNLFVTPEDRFTNFQPDSLDEENCGSAQNLFLLDEFYRSSIRLCGRYIIWYLISTKEEQQSYQDYVNFLTQGVSGMEQFITPTPTPAQSHIKVASKAINFDAIEQQSLEQPNKISFPLSAAPLISVCPLVSNHFIYIRSVNDLQGSIIDADSYNALVKDKSNDFNHHSAINTHSSLIAFSASMELAYPLCNQLYYAYPVVTNCLTGSILGNVKADLATEHKHPLIKAQEQLAYRDYVHSSNLPAFCKTKNLWAPSIMQLEEINNVAFADSVLAQKIDNDDLIDNEYIKNHGITHYEGFLSLKEWIVQLRAQEFSSGYISNYQIGSNTNVLYSLQSSSLDTSVLADKKARAIKKVKRSVINTIFKRAYEGGSKEVKSSNAKTDAALDSNQSYVGLNPQAQALLNSKDNQLTFEGQTINFAAIAQEAKQDKYIFLIKDHEGIGHKSGSALALDNASQHIFNKEDSKPFALDYANNVPSIFNEDRGGVASSAKETNVWYLDEQGSNQADYYENKVEISSEPNAKHDDLGDDEELYDSLVKAEFLSESELEAIESMEQESEASLDKKSDKDNKVRNKKRNRAAIKASVKMARVARSLAKSTTFNLTLQRLFPAQNNNSLSSNPSERLVQGNNQYLSSPYAQDLVTGSLDGELSGRVSFSEQGSNLINVKNERVSSKNVATLKKSKNSKAAGFERFAEVMGVTPSSFWGQGLALVDLASLTESNNIEDIDHYVDGNRDIASHRDTYPEWAYGRILTPEECVKAASEDNFQEFEAPLDCDEWFDFGSVVKSSPTEYFGSGLWLLYKAIESPFKVVLKILLMEAYSNDYPNNHLLSSELKDYMLSHDGYSLDLDSYYLMYLKVSNYLQSIKHESRLMLMRKCFYLKIFTGLSNKASYHKEDFKLKRELLNKFSVRWGWSKEFVNDLEQVATWKMEAVRKFNHEVYVTLLESYQSLLRFSVRHGIEYAITSDDAGILSRKLYAAFDRFPGKVMVINSSFSHNLEERNLTFICPSPQSLCKKGWHLYSAAGDDVALLNLKVSYIGSRLTEVVTWACFNGLLTSRTCTYVKGAPSVVTPYKIKRLSNDIMRVLEPKRGRVSEQSLQHSVKLKACLIVLNLEKDDTELLQNQLLDIDHNSTLCSGRSRACFVGSIDLIAVNSWGELRCFALPNGEEGVVELLATLLRIMNNTADTSQGVQSMLDLLEVCSYAAAYQDLIKYDVESTIRQVFNCLTTNSSSEYVFDVGRNTYVARNQGERGVMINKKSVFGSSEFDISILSRYGMRPEYALQVPPLVDRYATYGIVQYFFSPLNKGHWDIYIVNERNEVSTYRNYFGSRAALVNAINRFYTNQSQNRNENTVRFNLPQYFVLNQTLDAIHPFTIRGQAD